MPLLSLGRYTRRASLASSCGYSCTSTTSSATGIACRYSSGISLPPLAPSGAREGQELSCWGGNRQSPIRRRHTRSIKQQGDSPGACFDETGVEMLRCAQHDNAGIALEIVLMRPEGNEALASNIPLNFDWFVVTR